MRRLVKLSQQAGTISISGGKKAADRLGEVEWLLVPGSDLTIDKPYPGHEA